MIERRGKRVRRQNKGRGVDRPGLGHFSNVCGYKNSIKFSQYTIWKLFFISKVLQTASYINGMLVISKKIHQNYI
jgi:hypothetical protein